MTLLMRDQENIEKGWKEGIKEGRRAGKTEGEEKMLDLIQKLVEAGRFNEISKIKGNIEYRQKLYKEYGIFDD